MRRLEDRVFAETMAKQFERHKVAHEFITVKGAGHAAELRL